MNVLVNTSHEDAQMILDSLQIAWTLSIGVELEALIKRYENIVEQTRD